MLRMILLFALMFDIFHAGSASAQTKNHAHDRDPYKKMSQQTKKKRIQKIQKFTNDQNEKLADELTSEAVQDLVCERVGDSLRRLSNKLMNRISIVNQIADPVKRAQMQRKLRNKLFWDRIWSQMAEYYRSCEMDCFDDGLAVGQISGSGYCSVSTALDGLDSPGFLAQPALPLCQNEIFIGCQKGYGDAALNFEGCEHYTTGSFQQTFLESMSQDCHIESE